MAGPIAGIVGGLASQVLGGLVSQGVGSLVSQFGHGNTAGAMANSFMGGLGDVVKGAIQSSPMPSFLKDAACQVIDNVLGGGRQNTTPECQHKFDAEHGQQARDAGAAAGQQAINEADDETGGKRGSANWLVALAKALAKVQSKFIDAAMQNMQTMNNESGKMVQSQGGGQGAQGAQGGQGGQPQSQSSEFLKAQSEYQANMQMFNMASNVTSTSLKSIGEGLSAIARKQ